MFVSRKKYTALELELHDTKKQALAEVAENATLKRVIQAREEELTETGKFLRFLAQVVPDYEGYVLDYMEQEEFGDA